MDTDVILNMVSSIEKVRDNFLDEKYDEDVQDILYDLCWSVLYLTKFVGLRVTSQSIAGVRYCRQEVIRQNGGMDNIPDNVKVLVKFDSLHDTEQSRYNYHLNTHNNKLSIYEDDKILTIIPDFADTTEDEIKDIVADVVLELRGVILTNPMKKPLTKQK